MVRVLKCHSFASQKVIQIDKEPLTICADGDKVFVATSECEIVVYLIGEGSPKEIHRFPTVSLVENIIINSFKNYIITTELKKSWKGVAKSVRVYLQWEKSGKFGASKQRAKVRVAGKSHIQHTSGGKASDQVEIVEVPVGGNATSIAVCNYTGNFAIASGTEVKLCCLVEKTIANSDRTYLDVEVFLELCWNFPVQCMSLCEDYIVCCCSTEVQVVRLRYEEGERVSLRDPRKLIKSPSGSVASIQDGSRLSSAAVSPRSYGSEILVFPPAPSPEADYTRREERFTQLNPRDVSSVGMRPSGSHGNKLNTADQLMRPETKIIEDENYVEWDFVQGGSALSGNVDGGHVVCLPGLHTQTTQAHCHRHIVSPPVLSDFSGGKVKSSSGVQAETILHLSDPRGREEWMYVTLIPSHSTATSRPMSVSEAVCTDRMRSTLGPSRSSVCCYVGGSRGGQLYQVWPRVSSLSLYRYTDSATQVGVSDSFLHVVTQTGIETYTSRWGAVAMEMREQEIGATVSAIPSSSLDVCLCGHEPFFSTTHLSVGRYFLALLSKVEDNSAKDREAHWGIYVLHSFTHREMYKDMVSFAERIQSMSSASYIHLLQEAHHLVSTHPTQRLDLADCTAHIATLMGDFFAQPGQVEWARAWPLYHCAGVSVETVVSTAVDVTGKTPKQFGRGLIDFLDNELFSQEGYITLSATCCNSILDIYAVAAPHCLSQVILLSNVKKYSPEIALRHLKTWLAVKASSEGIVSPLDQLALIQVNLELCELDLAVEGIRTIPRAGLLAECATHPALLREGGGSLPPLGQLMRQHVPGTLVQALVNMLDTGDVTLDTVLGLLKSDQHTDILQSAHVREVLELVVSDKKREFLFDEAVPMLCQAYLASTREKKHLTYRQLSALAHQKFTLPQGDGHFAPRFAWLDHLPPFNGPQSMSRPCQKLGMKHIMSTNVAAKSRSTSALVLGGVGSNTEPCACCLCNESLLKLQSLLCSRNLTEELAESLLKEIGQSQGETWSSGGDREGDGRAGVIEEIERRGQVENLRRNKEQASDGSVEKKKVEAGENILVEKARTQADVEKGEGCDESDRVRDVENSRSRDVLDSVRLLCLVKVDVPRATKFVVEKYPGVAASFSGCCLDGELNKFAHLLRCLETVLRSFGDSHKPTSAEEVYVNAYKDVLWRLTEELSPAQFLSILPADGNFYFLLPFLSAVVERAQREKLKEKIVMMGHDLVSS